VSRVAITGIGIVAGSREARPIPWPVRDAASSRRYRPVADLQQPPGPARVHAMIERALAECGGGGPVVIASCNGTAASWRDDDWRGSFAMAGAGAVTSAACASGMHALALGKTMIEAGEREVRVVAVDIVTPPAHDNFEALRVLSDEPAPFTDGATGFQMGEAAVALRLGTEGGVDLEGPLLGYDLDGDDAIARGLAALSDVDVELVVAQGAGPAAGDAAELAAIRMHVDPHVPVTTALARFGHTLGASSLLSVALAAEAGRAIAVCRALGGACGVVRVGRSGTSASAGAGAGPWGTVSALPPLRDPVLRRMAADARAHRPAEPPGMLIVTLDAPLPPSARIGHRILPTSVLEMTPGFCAQLVARAWGFRGPAICLVGPDPDPLLAACRRTHDRVFRVAIRGMHGGDADRDIEWNA
jgi:hypothetical protein